jgi:hypothetical protein
MRRRLRIYSNMFELRKASFQTYWNLFSETFEFRSFSMFEFVVLKIISVEIYEFIVDNRTKIDINAIVNLISKR